MPKLTFSNNAHLSYVPVSDKGPDLKFRPGMFVTGLRLWNNSRYNLFWLNSGQLCLSLPSEEQKGASVEDPLAEWQGDDKVVEMELQGELHPWELIQALISDPAQTPNASENTSASCPTCNIASEKD